MHQITKTTTIHHTEFIKFILERMKQKKISKKFMREKLGLSTTGFYNIYKNQSSPRFDCVYLIIQEILDDGEEILIHFK